MIPTTRAYQPPPGSLYILSAVVFLTGVQLLVTRRDLPLGVLLSTVPIALILGALLKENRSAKWGIRGAVVLVVLACVVTEMASKRVSMGITIFAVASYAAWAWQQSTRARSANLN